MSKYLTTLVTAIFAITLMADAIAKSGRFISAAPSNVQRVSDAPEPVGERASRVGLLDVDLSQLYSGGPVGKPSRVPIPGRSLEMELFPNEVYWVAPASTDTALS